MKSISSSNAHEGLPSKETRLWRTRQVIELANNLERDDSHRILVYSPPFSGKTCLARLLQLYLTIVRKRVVILLNCCRFPSDPSVQESNQMLIDMGFAQCSSSSHLSRDDFSKMLENEATDVIVDDAQKIYGVQDFWGIFKEKTGKHLICFSSYSITSTGCVSTPVIFQQRIPISFLLFNRIEFDKLAKQFVVKKDTGTSWRDGAKMIMKEELYRLTSGYPGLVTFGLRLISTQYPNGGLNEIDLHKFYKDLTQPEQSRCFKEIKDIDDYLSAKLDAEEQKMSRTIILKCLDRLVTCRSLARSNLITLVTQNMASGNKWNKLTE